MLKKPSMFMTEPARFPLFIPAAVLFCGCSLFFDYPDNLASDADGDDGDLDEHDPDSADDETGEDAQGEDPAEEEIGPFCGDGEQNGTEECDDGNDTSGDGCESDCTFSCTAATQETDCDDGESCTDDACNESAHLCSNTPVTEGTPCSDGDDCTYPDACSDAGRCEGVTIDPCQDTWVVRFDLNQVDPLGTSIIETADGAYVVVGSSSDVGPGGLDMWVARLSPVGTVQWQKAVGGPGAEFACDVIQTSDGNLLVAGASTSWTYPWPDDIDQRSGYLVKLGPDGRVLWQRVLGGLQFDEIRAVTETSTGSIAFTGIYNGQTPSQYAWVGLLDADGNLLWHAIFESSRYAEGTSIIETSDGNLLVGGTGIDNPENIRDGWLLKIEAASGSLLWSRALEGSNYVLVNDVVENPATGGIILAGSQASLPSGSSLTFGEISANGNAISWMSRIYYDFGQNALNVILESGGGLLLSGRVTVDAPSSILHHWAARLNGRDASAALVWNKLIGETGNAYETMPGALIESESGHVVMSTWIHPDVGQWDLMVIKMNADAEIDGSCGQIYSIGGGLSSGGIALSDIEHLGVHEVANGAKSPSGTAVDTAIPLTFVCPE